MPHWVLQGKIKKDLKEKRKRRCVFGAGVAPVRKKK